MNTIGHNIKITFFGESHSSHIGVVINGLPVGLNIDENLIKFNLTKRRPINNISTSRIEADNYKILSGYFNGFTTGAPLSIIIENNNILSKNYDKLHITPRPSHSDYPASVKYKGFNDFRGGGFFSGRLTALWIIIGSISEQLLKKQNILVGSHIFSLKNIEDTPFEPNKNDGKVIIKINKENFPLINTSKKEEMIDLINKTKNNLDSLGGIIETKVINVPIGLGEPYFLSVESYISQLLFSIPGLKGVEFGKGFEISKYLGSKMNDQYVVKNNKITTLSNNNGGILGGITNGQPIIIKSAFKPTSSIGLKQKSINLNNLSNVDLTINGRHDPQFVSRASHVVTAVVNYAILDLLLFELKKDVLI